MRINFNSPPFEFKMSGRSGELIYSDKNRKVSLFVEMSGTPKYDILVSFDSLKDGKWSDGNSISKEELETIKQALIYWSNCNNIKCQW